MISEIATAGEKGYVILVTVVLVTVVIAVIIGLLLLHYVLRNKSVSEAKHFISFLVLILATDLVLALDVLGIGIEGLPAIMIVGVIILIVFLIEFIFLVHDYQKGKHTETGA